MNGALAVRERKAPSVEIVEAETDEDDRRRRQHYADEIDLTRAALVGLEAEAQQENDGRNDDQNSERRAPAD